MQSDGRARIKEQGEVGATGKGKKAGYGPVNNVIPQRVTCLSPLKDLCNRINCTCHGPSVITLIIMLKGTIPKFLDINPVETSVMCRIHL